MWKKLATLLVASASIAVLSSTNVGAAPHFCDFCCYADGYGGAHRLCELKDPVICGDACTCPKTSAKLFACYPYN